jgi:hypothetical protein
MFFLLEESQEKIMISKRLLFVVLTSLTMLVLLPVLPVAAAGTPSSPILTTEDCTLTLEFDVTVAASYTLELWDNGTIIWSETQIGGVGDHLVFEGFLENGVLPGGAPGIGVVLSQGASLVYLADPYTGLDQSCAESIAGRCEVYMTNQAVVGQVTTTTPTYFAPHLDAATDTVLEAGSTWWVSGVDASGAFYKTSVACSEVWVPVSAMGPNFDEVWQGTPLPTTMIN